MAPAEPVIGPAAASAPIVPLPICRTPAEIVVVPVYVFAPVNVVVPLPAFVKPTVPEPLVITPANVVFVAALLVSVTEPAVLLVITDTEPVPLDARPAPVPLRAPIETLKPLRSRNPSMMSRPPPLPRAVALPSLIVPLPALAAGSPPIVVCPV